MNAIQTLASSLSFLVAAALPAQISEAAGKKPDEQILVDALNLFAADLHQQVDLASSPTCSPASISFVLLMLLPGARGNTAEEIRKTLRLPPELRGERLTEATAQLLQKTVLLGECTKGVALELHLANDFWGQTGHEFVPEYLELLKTKLGSWAHEVDFKSDCDGARRQINRHIAIATNQRITELIPAGMVTPDTRTVISNAIWYRGKWQHDFYRPKKLGTFHVTPDRTVEASMMHVTKDWYYTENDAWQAVTMPFVDQAVAFELIVPREGQSLATAERALLRGEHNKNRKVALVRVSMPALRVRAEHRLRAPLNALGIRDAFDVANADFTGIDAKQPLNIDEVVHATWIQVDEHGVEAAAATAAVLKAGAAIREEPKVLVADRPFAFGLRDRRTGLLLFVARCTDPTVEG